MTFVNSLIGRMWMSDPSTGEAPMSGAGFITLKYNFHRQVAERIDARGVVFRYVYDVAGQLTRTLSPYHNPAAGGTFNREERLYY